MAISVINKTSRVLLPLLMLALLVSAALGATWQTSDPLTTARYLHTATLLPNGKVLVAGGTIDNINPLQTCELYDPTTGAWSSTGSLSLGRFGHSATLLPNGKVLVAGGGNGSTAFITCEVYDPNGNSGAGSWSSTGALLIKTFYHTATLLNNGTVLVAGGDGGAGQGMGTCEVYDPSAGTWSLTGSLATARMYHSATLLPDGQVLVAGGYNGSSHDLASCEVYNPAAGTWSPTGALSKARQSHSATLLPTGKVLVASGYNGIDHSVTTICELYNPSDGTWSTTGSVADPRYWHTATLLPNGKVLVTGGDQNIGGDVVILSNCELFDPTAGTWSTAQALSTGAEYHTATLLPDGKVLVAGGYNDNMASTALATCEVYNPATGSWSNTGSVTSGRYNFTATLLQNSKVLVVGGSNPDNLASCELFDPGAGAWSAAGTLFTSRNGHSSTLLSNGKVLVAGGYSPMTSCEVYDPTAGTWSRTGALSYKRYAHTSTLLADGKVLVAGGFDGTNQVLTCEVYDPTSETWSKKGSLIAGRYGHTAALLRNGQVLVAAGIGGTRDTCELYNPATGTWSATGSLAAGRYGHGMTVLQNGKVLVVGGYDGGTRNSCELYNPATGTWSATGSLAMGRYPQVNTTLLPNGKVLVVGGSGGGSIYLTSSEVYDPASGTWSAGANLNTGRYRNVELMLPNGKVLEISGQGAAGYLTSCELLRYTEYDYTANAGMQPAISTVNGSGSFPVAVSPNTAYAITGSNFKGLAEGSAGTFASSPTNYPRVYLTAADGATAITADATTTLYPISSWTNADNSLSFSTPAGLPQGSYLLSVLASAVPSDGKMIYYSTSAAASPPVTYVVTNCADSGNGSLRQVIADANATPGSHTITFNIPTTEAGYTYEAGVHFWKIKPTSAGYNLTQSNVVVDATTQTTNQGDQNPLGPEVMIDGGSIGGFTSFSVWGDNCTIEGLVFSNLGSESSAVRIAGLNDWLLGCYVGLDPSGAAASGNFLGISVDGSYCRIGDGTAAGMNVISGNGSFGLELSGSSNEVRGNRIGTNALGTAALGNDPGIIVDGGYYNRIGGSAVGDGNLISGNTNGIIFSGDYAPSGSNEALGNMIGTNAAGTGGVPNSADGVLIADSSANLVGPNNTLAYNGATGVKVTGNGLAGRNTITQNLVHDNTGLGIQLDGTSNLSVAAPTIEAATIATGVLTGEAPANSTVEVFATGNPDPSGAGEGRTFLGSTEANGSGQWSLTLGGLTVGTTLTATATDTNHNTSQFSVNLITVGDITFEVTNTNDSGYGSLRQAITNANDIAGAHIITFNIPTSEATTEAGVTFWRIQPSSSLPPITKAGTVIGGTTQPTDETYNNPYGPEIVLDGSLMGGGDGLTVAASDCTIEGLVINYGFSGIYINGSSRNQVLGCYLGTDATGTSARGNVIGVQIFNGAYNRIGDGTVVGRNLLSGNAWDGVWITDTSSSNEVLGNFIGTTISGEASLANNQNGVCVFNTSEANTISGNLISGNSNGPGINISFDCNRNRILNNKIGCDLTGSLPLPNAQGLWIFESNGTVIGSAEGRNIISGNSYQGMDLPGSNSTEVVNNYIGCDATGSFALPNSQGVVLNGSAYSLISGNVISGNSGPGIAMGGASSSNEVLGNMIGVNATGDAVVGNGDIGVAIDSSFHNVIGDGTLVGRNVISGNVNGINSENSGDQTILGNYIGVDVTGTREGFGNVAYGIRLNNSSSDQIGNGTELGRNIISGSGYDGLVLMDTRYCTIEGNYIGTDRTGSFPLRNQRGIYILSMGSISALHRIVNNVISGNDGSGIQLDSTSSIEVLGNMIGVNAAGDAIVPNGGYGLYLAGGNDIFYVIGNGTPAGRNVISGNQYGIVSGNGSSYLTILGNYIGVDITGTREGFGNLVDGLNLATGSNILIGNGTEFGRNLVSGNGGFGIALGTITNSTIEGNYIGTDVTGAVARPNYDDGIYIYGSSTNNQIGPDNLIANSSVNNGVEVDGDTSINNTITSNSIYDNARLGIFLNNNGNNNLAAPVITDATLDAVTGSTEVRGTATTTTGTIELFLAGVSDPTGFGEGRAYLGSTQEVGGTWTMLVGPLTEGTTLTATVTDADGNTSQFSENWPPIFQVVNTNDDGRGSLRQVINLANSYPDFYRITFNIPTSDLGYTTEAGVSFWRITPAGGSPLPAITREGVVIDGTTQSDTNPDGPDIMIDGANIGFDGPGITVAANNCTVEGLAIASTFTAGIYLSNASGCQILGNYLGAGPAGNFYDCAQNNQYGLQLDGSSHNRIGDGTAAGRNIMSGNQVLGLELINASNSNEVLGNYFGTDASGLNSLPNGGGMEFTQSSYNKIGNGTVDGRNVISGNSVPGISLYESSSNEVLGNYIGCQADGVGSLGNMVGIYVWIGSNDNIIGDGTANGRNVISDNGDTGVILVNSSGNQVLGNYIGCQADGVGSLGNLYAGVSLYGADAASPTNNNLVGANNTIANNGLYGVRIDIPAGSGGVAQGNTVTQNSIHDNTFLGIGLYDGANQGIAAPQIVFASNSGVTGEAPANSTIEVFATGAYNLAGIAEGRTFLGSTESDPDGQWTLSFSPALTDGTSLTATATDQNGNTSQFSMNWPAPFMVVTNTNDDGPGSLRQVISYANAWPGINIGFNIPASDPGFTTEAGASFWRITPTSAALPALIRSGTVIDGTTQPTVEGNNPYGPEIMLDGSLSGGADGITVNANACTIEGLVISGFNSAIYIDFVNNNMILGNYLGCDPSGTIRVGNWCGISMAGSNNYIGDGTVAGRNIISGDTVYGIGNDMVSGDWNTSDWGRNNYILGNYIGTNADGLATLSNDAMGSSGISFHHLSYCTIEGNVIADWSNGVFIYIADQVQMTNNLIGVDRTGSYAIPNDWAGIWVNNLSYCTFEGNVISGNNGVGFGFMGDHLQIKNNLIGVDRTGNNPLPNGNMGLLVHGALSNEVGSGNIVAYNGAQGIYIDDASQAITITQNSFHDNLGLGIELNNGVNQNIAAPTILAADKFSATGEAVPNATVEVFATGDPDPTGSGEGKTYLGSALADGGGQWSLTFSSRLSGLTTLSATATDPTGNTSQFGPNVAVDAPFFDPYMVITTADSGEGSLHQCILNANAAAEPHTIAFNIPTGEAMTEGGVYFWRISAITVLPAITREGVVIDATTQPTDETYNNPYGPEIMIYSGAGYAGLELAADHCTIEGLAIGSKNAAIYLNNASGCQILRCYLGTNVKGDSAVTNSYGLRVVNGSSNTVIRDNLFSGNNGIGIDIQGGGSNEVLGNKIGCDVTGTREINNGIGLSIENSLGDKIGGSASGEGNLISGNNNVGIYLISCDRTTLLGNYVGTDVTGTIALYNRGNAAFWLNDTSNCQIGDGTAGGRNLFVHTNNLDIWLNGASNNNLFTGNNLSVGVNGEALPNNQPGLVDYSVNHGNQFGPGNVVANTSLGMNIPENMVVTQNSFYDNYYYGIGSPLAAPSLSYAGLHPLTGSLEVGGTATANGTIELFVGVGPTPGTHYYYEGKTYLATTYEATGNWKFGLDPTLLTRGTTLTATVTLVNGTSGFGQPTWVYGLPEIAVQVPAGGLTYPRDTDLAVSWVGYGVPLDTVNIYYSLDGGATFPYVVTREAVNSSPYTWHVPNVTSDQARVRIEGVMGSYITTAETTDFSIVTPVFTVETTADEGEGSLRQVINYANSYPDFTRVTFNIPLDQATTEGGATFWRITPASQLPTLVRDGIVIDGTTQPTNEGNNPYGPEIMIDGSVVGGGGDGLTIAANNCTIEGLVISHGFNNALQLSGVAGCQVLGNYVGTDPTGRSRLQNSNGVVLDGSSNNWLGNGTAGGRNVLSGNNRSAIFMVNGSNSNNILGNYCGTDPTGLNAVSNSGGVDAADSSNNIIGDGTPGGRNILSGNDFGIRFQTVCNSNKILGNYIGCQADGVSLLGNIEGILLYDNSNDNSVGDGTDGGRNVISGNAYMGVDIDDSSSNEVLGNYIGSAADGVGVLGNGVYGVSIFGFVAVTPAVNNLIGANTIVNSGADGVRIDMIPSETGAALGNTITRNSLHDNGDLGIVLQGGANQDVPAPTILAADKFSATGESVANVTVEVFATGDPDPSGSGEGKTYLGSALADGGGQWSLTFSSRLSGLTTLSATATDPTGNTSQFGPNVAVDAPFFDPYTVITTADAGDGSLRQCIENANAATEAVTIRFNIPTAEATLDSGYAYWRIVLANQVPTITRDGAVIDATTQPTDETYNNPYGPEIMIDGNAGGFDGLVLTADHCTVEGLVVANCNQGVSLDNARGCQILNCYLGTDPKGDSAVANNYDGLLLRNDSSYTVIRDNLISGNYGHGIEMQDSGSSEVLGNKIGCDISGANTLPNNGNGLNFYHSSGNRIGDGTTAGRNVISGNAQLGIWLSTASHNTRILGNYIGCNGSGTAGLSNGSGAIVISDSSNNQIGDGTAGGRNVLVCTSNVVLSLGPSNYNTIQGNYFNVGLGGEAFPSASPDIVIGGGGNPSDHNLIGPDNIIANSLIGVIVNNDSRDDVITRNSIYGSLVCGIAPYGGNENVQAPQLSYAGLHPLTGSLEVAGTATANGTIELFEAVGPTPYTGYFYEGKTYVDSTFESTGNWKFEFDPTLLTRGSTLTATVTPTPGTSPFGQPTLVYGLPEQVINVPAGGNTYARDTDLAVSWVGYGVPLDTVNLYYSLDGGANFPYVITREAANVSPITWHLPNVTSNQARVRIEGMLGSYITTAETSDFSIVTPVFTVETTADEGEGSLRQVINYANSYPGFNRVTFNIPLDQATTEAGASFWRITPLTPLPAIVRAGTVIDGTTQTANQGNANPNGPEIVIDGLATQSLPGSIHGLEIDANDCTIEGLVINNFNGSGLYLNGANRSVVAGNFIGVNAAGDTVQYNGNGIDLNSSGNCLISGNLASGNGSGLILTNSSNNRVMNNKLGCDLSGLIALPNGQGLWLDNANNNLIGSAEGRNIISGNISNGLYMYNGSQGNVLENNYFGCQANGTGPLPNADWGMQLDGCSNNLLIGNVFSGNGYGGLALNGSSNNQIMNNKVGCDAAGTAALPNGTVGLGLYVSSLNTVEGNVISGNIYGLNIYNSSGNAVLNNYIGCQAGGVGSLGNGLYGVSIRSDDGSQPASNNMIGANNTIAYNGLNGVLLTIADGSGGVAQNNTVTRNSIHDNGDLGIILQGGANQNIAAPTIIAADQFSATGEAVPNAAVEVFATGVPDPTGSGEGETYLGSTLADGDGRWSLLFDAPLTRLTTLSATATDTNANTSMFGWDVVVDPLILTLNISRDADTVGSDVVISWVTEDVPDVYALTGDGSGVYTNEISAWGKVTNPTGPGFTLLGNELRHTGQVGTGTGEAYYKALQAGAVKADYLPSAEAVGKFNIYLNAALGAVPICDPFIPINSTISSVIGGQLTAGDYATADRLYTWLDNGSIQESWYNSSGPAWSGNLTDISVGRGYWAVIYPGHSSKTITLVGRVLASAATISLPQGVAFRGMPYTRATEFQSSGLNSVLTAGTYATADRLYSWDNSGGLLEGWFNSTGTVWNGNISGFAPGKGYWIMNQSGPDSWLFPRQ